MTALATLPGYAQPAPAGPSPILAQPEQFADHVWDRTHDGRSYRVFIKVIGTPGANGYPVLYLLDGNALFDALAQQRITAPQQPMILVGLGYPTGNRFDFTGRAWDYTPPQADGGPDPDPMKPERAGGGANAFYQWLDSTLRPEIARHWAINPQQQALYGHSYGGLFALHTLLQHPTAFRHWMIASPSTWRSAPQLQQGLQAFSLSPGQHPPSVLLLSGGQEQTQRQAHSVRAALASAAPSLTTLQQRLSQQLPVQLEVLPGQSHGAMIDAGLERGFQWLVDQLRTE